MGGTTEIERKFLVKGDFHSTVCGSTRIVQGYICSAPGRTVRVRLSGEKGYLTIKGPACGSDGQVGISRFEWEKEISAEEAGSLMKLCEPGVIDKVRHLVKAGSHIWEVDEFHGDNEGLVVAEIELSSEDEEFERPDWLGPEVSSDRRYFNSSLIKNPYKNWK